MDLSKIPLSIYQDLSKAFDTLQHFTIQSKLDNYDVSGISNDSFKSYFVGRKQNVYFDGVESEKKIDDQCLQVSALGLLLFYFELSEKAISSSIFVTLYKSIALPHFNYCLLVGLMLLNSKYFELQHVVVILLITNPSLNFLICQKQLSVKMYPFNTGYFSPPLQRYVY